MVMGATEKMAFQTAWDPLDYLIVDMPPGTGDIHLSLAQNVEVTGALVVSTPQAVALADAQKGVAMFNSVGIPVLGLVENMNAFVCGHCGGVTHVFGEDGAKRLAERIGVDLWASVPLDPEIMRNADSGKPIVLANPGSKAAGCYGEMARRLAAKCD